MNDSDPAPRSISHHSPSACEIDLQNPCGYREAGARRIRPWLTPLVRELAPSAGSVAVRFVSDREMRRLSKTYRNKDRSTDVLTFVGDFPSPDDRGFSPANSEESPGLHKVSVDGQLPDLGGFYLGDIVISVPTARRQAEQLGHGVELELKTLLLHGLLHCLGYDHEQDDGTMERLESGLRRRYGLEPEGAS